MLIQTSGSQTGFVAQFESLFGAFVDEFVRRQDPRRGPSPKLCASQLLSALVYHVMAGAGVFSDHVRELFHVEIKDSSLSERRQRMGFEPFAWLMRHALRPMADPGQDPSCFYKGLRLCGIDGTKWSVTNTPQILAKMTKAASRRFDAAFAKVEMCALVELGLHNPLAAEIGLKGEGEWDLAERLLERLPESSLLVVDRLYGCGKYLREIIAACRSRRSQVLVRARANVKSRVIKEYSDGSALVAIRPPQTKGCPAETIEVREIRGRIRKPGGKQWTEVRIWTTLLNPKAHPAMELMKLYGRRWEHEIFYKELKIGMRGGDVLHSHTPETAAQEVAALLMACSILAERRLEIARSGEIEPLRISFARTLDKMTALWMILAEAGDLVEEATGLAILECIRASILRQATPARRARTSPRKVRQPVSSWPRLTQNDSNEGAYDFELVRFP